MQTVEIDIPGWSRPHTWMDTWPVPGGQADTEQWPHYAPHHSDGACSAPSTVQHHGTWPWCEPHTFHNHPERMKPYVKA